MINSPPTTAVDRLQIERGKPVLTGVIEGWRNFFQAVFTICNAVSQSGPTSERPSEGLYVGRIYFDTTLGQPVWYESPGWVDAAGAPA